MLAGTCEDTDTLKYPVFATPKLDGIRCIVIDGVAMSRALKPIPNRHVQKMIGIEAFNGMDGELIVKGSFQDVSSAIMSEDGEPDFTFNVFDIYDTELGYLERMDALKEWQHDTPPYLKILLPVMFGTVWQLTEYVETCVNCGYEGVMVRSAYGPYKHGRSTVKEGWLLKIKPFHDAEAAIVGFEEAMHNANKATVSELGRTKRSSHKANQHPKGTLGALMCRNDKLWPDEKFKVGTGFDDALRSEIWKNRSKYLGKVVKFKYQKMGTKDKPRTPVFLGFRHKGDMTPDHLL